MSRFSLECFLSQFAEGFHRGILYCFNNLGYRKTLRRRKGVRESRFSLEIFVSHGTKKTRRGTLLCFTKSLLTKILRTGEWGGEGEPLRPSVKCFCLTVPKSIVEEPFCVSQKLCCRKIVVIGEVRWEDGSNTTFCLKFLSHTARKVCKGTLYCVTNFGYRKT